MAERKEIFAQSRSGSQLLLRPEFRNQRQRPLLTPLRPEFARAQQRKAQPVHFVMMDERLRRAPRRPAILEAELNSKKAEFQARLPPSMRNQQIKATPSTLRNWVEWRLADALRSLGDSDRGAIRTAAKLNTLLDFTPVGTAYSLDEEARRIARGDWSLLREPERIGFAVLPGGRRAKRGVDDVLRGVTKLHPEQLISSGDVTRVSNILPKGTVQITGEPSRLPRIGPKAVVSTGRPARAPRGYPRRPAAAHGNGLPMDEASRMRRAREQNYHPEPVWHGDRTKRVPNEYPDVTIFARSKKDADIFARRGDHDESREFLLSPKRVLRYDSPHTARDLTDVVRAMKKMDDMRGAKLVMKDAGFEGWSPKQLDRYASRNPDEELGSGKQLHDSIHKHAWGNAEPVLVRAGFDAVDRMEDVMMLTGKGIRLKSAAFDPERRESRNIHYNYLPPLVGATLAAGAAAPYSSQVKDTSGSK